MPSPSDQSDSSILQPCHIKIHYCSLCRWLLRSAWMGQELLMTFENEIAELSLLPNTQGNFSIWVDDQCVWERKRDNGFPELPLLKQRVRDVVNPNKSLGHSDIKDESDK